MMEKHNRETSNKNLLYVCLCNMRELRERKYSSLEYNVRNITQRNKEKLFYSCLTLANDRLKSAVGKLKTTSHEKFSHLPNNKHFQLNVLQFKSSLHRVRIQNINS